MKPCLLLHLTLLCLFGFTLEASARELPKVDLESYEPWEEETVHAFENILVQHEGRVKPIYTVARFTLMQFSGKSSVKFETTDGEQHNLHYAEWMLDVLFRGQIAKDLPVFVVDNSQAIVQIGVSPKSRRDKYTYNELFAGRAKLAQLAAEYAEKQKKYQDSEKDPQYELTAVEGMVLTLGRNISSFEYLLGQFGFARKGEILVNENILPEDVKRLAKTVDSVEMINKMPEMTLEQLVQTIRQPVSDSEDERMFSAALRAFFFHANSARGLNLFPPQDPESEEWKSAGDALIDGLESKEVRPWATDSLQKLQAVVKASNEDEKTFRTALQTFSDEQHKLAETRGEGTHSEMEISLYRGQWFYYSLVLFVLGFIILAFSWLSPATTYGKVMILVSAIIALIAVGLTIYGISLRSIIRQRPPITNLYDTILFITATAVLLGLFIEWATRIGIGAFIAIISGVFGMFLSMKYEAKEATDTMGQLVAVLDTNFWLATHVTIINVGYAAGLVAAIIGIVYLLMQFWAKLSDMAYTAFVNVYTKIITIVYLALTIVSFAKVDTVRQAMVVSLKYTFILVCLFNILFLISRIIKSKAPPKELSRALTRMNYGVICFCLFFSLVGTVLGGIWANYSWGRFWGWDPKENGALMICLWTLVILHGRMGGMIREIGLHMNSIILAIIVTFSWWGVNNLGVGLHSYGFTEGVWGALYASWAILGIFLLMGVICWFVERSEKMAKSAKAPAKEAEPQSA